MTLQIYSLLNPLFLESFNFANLKYTQASMVVISLPSATM